MVEDVVLQKMKKKVFDSRASGWERNLWKVLNVNETESLQHLNVSYVGCKSQDLTVIAKDEGVA